MIARRTNQRVVEWIDGLDPEAVYLSVITIGEIRKGIAKPAPSRRQDDLASWLMTDLLHRFAGKIVAITTDVLLVWGELTGRLERAGTSLPAIDSLIAASALQGSFTLVTRNDTDFRNAGLSVINPWASS